MNKMDNFSREELISMVNESSTYAELMKKIGYSKSGSALKIVKNKLADLEISTEHFKKNVGIERNPDNIFIKNSTADQKTLRKYYYNGGYSEYKCSICGLEPFWNGKELTLTLDHINGNHTDDRLENLRWVCPNCDRQLPTFAGRNNGKHAFV